MPNLTSNYHYKDIPSITRSEFIALENKKKKGETTDLEDLQIKKYYFHCYLYDTEDTIGNGMVDMETEIGLWNEYCSKNKSKLIFYKEEPEDDVCWLAYFIVVSDKVMDFMDISYIKDFGTYDDRFIVGCISDGFPKYLKDNDLEYTEVCCSIPYRFDDGENVLGKRFDGPNWIGEVWLEDELKKYEKR
jgi:hypothetical protein